MPKIEVETEFAVGDLVALKALVATCEPKEIQTLSIVYILVYFRCDATEIVYMCRVLVPNEANPFRTLHGFSGDSVGGLFKVYEGELVAFPTAAMSEGKSAD